MQVRSLVVVAVLGTPVAAAPCRAPKAVSYEAKLDGARVVVCFDRGPRPCWRLDLAKLAWQLASARPSFDLPPAPTLPSAAIITACAHDGSACHTVTTPTGTGLHVVTEGAVIAAVEDERITVVDATTNQVWSTIAPWPHPDNQVVWSFRGDVRFIGPDHLFVELGDGGSTFARILATRGGATVRELPGEVDSAPAVVLGAELAVASRDGTKLIFVDGRGLPPAGSAAEGRRGSIDGKRFSLRTVPLFATPGPLSVLAATPTAIVAVQNGGDGSVAVGDGKTTKLVPGPPACR